MRNVRKYATWLVAVTLLGAVVGCDDDTPDPTDGGTITDGAVAETGELRLWHLADAAGAVDVFVDGEAALTNFEFEQNTAYFDIAAGPHDFDVAPAGAGIEAAVISVDAFAIDAGERWTIIAAQLNADSAAAGAFAALPIREDAAATIGADEIGLRLFHAAYTVPGAVDLHDGTTPGLPEIADGLAQGTATAAAAVVPNAAYDVALDVDDDGIPELVTAAPLDMPPAGTRVLAGAISKADGGSVETEIVYLVGDGENIHDEVGLDEAEVGFVRLWHLAAGAGTVDVFFDETAIATGVDFEGNTAYAPFLAGTYDIVVAATGAGVGSPAISVPDFALGGGQSFTIIATQLLEDATAENALGALPILENRLAPAAGQIRFRVFHAAYAVSANVNVHNIDGGDNAVIVDDLAQGAVGDPPGVEVPNGAYTLGLDVNRDGAIDLQTVGAIDMPLEGALITIGAISKPEGEETETELVFLINDGPSIHDEIGLEPFVD